MTSVNEKAYAKINISLDVTGKRPDGYHDMLMVMQTITLCDDITVALTPGEASRAECNLRFVPCDERNLAVRAANAFFAHCGVENMGATGAGRQTDLPPTLLSRISQDSVRGCCGSLVL